MRQKTKFHQNSSDRCAHCGHWSGDADVPFRIYSEERASWLESAAQQLKDCEGDDEWIDWLDEGRRLDKEKL
jgi:hypothetical protein